MADAPVLVPLEPSLWEIGAPRPPVSVELPLVCRPKRIAIFVRVVGFLMALASAATAYALIPAFRASHGALVALGSGALFLCASYVFAPVGLLYLPNALRPGPALIIDEAGLDHRRQKLRLRRDEISQAQIRANRGGWFAAIALRTRDGAAKRTSQLRRRRIPAARRSERHPFLAPAPELAALLMVKLVERAGGAVEGKPFWAQ